MKKVRHLLRIVAFLLIVIPANSFALETAKCIAAPIIKWTHGGEIDYGEFHPEGEGTISPDDTNEPRVLAVDSKDNIYVADPVNYRVLKFNKNGKLESKIKLQKPNLSTPRYGNDIKDMTVDKFDNLYLINYYQNRVEIYNSDGKFLRIIDYSKDKLGKKIWEDAGRNYDPDNIQVDYDGNVYIYRELGSNSPTGAIYSKDGILLKRLTVKGISSDVYKISENTVNGRVFDKKMVDYSGYYIANENYDARQIERRIIILKDNDGRELKKCGPVDIELTTRTYVDKKGNVYFFEFNTLNIMKVKMREK